MIKRLTCGFARIFKCFRISDLFGYYPHPACDLNSYLKLGLKLGY